MAHHSQQRRQVYFRPLAPLTWVLVDDLTPSALQWMPDDGVHPGVVVETNPHTPDNLQAWVCIGRDVSDDVATSAARILARRYGGDRAAVGSERVGCVVGTYNAKPQHWRYDNKPPLVKLRFADTTGVTFVPSIRTEAEMLAASEPTRTVQIGTVVELSSIDDDEHAMFDYLHEQHADPSKADFVFCCKLIEVGSTAEKACAALMFLRDKSRDRPDSYARPTVERAWRSVMGDQADNDNGLGTQPQAAASKKRTRR